jgi:hypothetical protein
MCVVFVFLFILFIKRREAGEIMSNEELPEWLLPYTDNYTGPFWSDGKFQASVANGKTKPKSKLDKFSKKHDASYFNAHGDAGKLNQADREYYDNTRSMSFWPSFIGSLPLYNIHVRELENFLSGRKGGVKMSKYTNRDPLQPGQYLVNDGHGNFVTYTPQSSKPVVKPIIPVGGYQAESFTGPIQTPTQVNLQQSSSTAVPLQTPKYTDYSPDVDGDVLSYNTYNPGIFEKVRRLFEGSVGNSLSRPLTRRRKKRNRIYVY